MYRTKSAKTKIVRKCIREILVLQRTIQQRVLSTRRNLQKQKEQQQRKQKERGRERQRHKEEEEVFVKESDKVL
jgi:hypothetical protein